MRPTTLVISALALTLPTSAVASTPTTVQRLEQLSQAITEHGLARSPPAASRDALRDAFEGAFDRAVEDALIDAGVKETSVEQERDRRRAAKSLIEASLRDALAAQGANRRRALFELTRDVTDSSFAAGFIATWLGHVPLVPPPLPEDHAGWPLEGLAAQDSEPRALVIDAAASRIVAERGHGGSGNGVPDLGEWVELELIIENTSAQPWFSTSASLESRDACAWTDPVVEYELAEMEAARPEQGDENIAKLRAWVYIAPECGPEKARRFSVTLSDTHRTPKEVLIIGLSLRPGDIGRPALRTMMLDTDVPGSSDGSGRWRVGPELDLELSTQVTLRSSRSALVKTHYAVPEDLKPLFAAATYRSLDLGVGSPGIYVPSDDLDVTTTASGVFTATLEGATASRRWVLTEEPRLWVAVDVEVVTTRGPEVVAPQPTPAPDALPAEPRKLHSLTVESLILVVKQHARLVAHPVPPAIPGATRAVSGYELVFDEAALAASLATLKVELEPEPSPEPVAAPAPRPVPYLYRRYISLPLDGVPRRPPPVAEAPEPEPEPGPSTPARYHLDIGLGAAVYSVSDPRNIANYWGGVERLVPAVVGVRFGWGDTLSVGAAVRYGNSKLGGRGAGHELQGEAYLGYQLAAHERVTLMPYLALGGGYRYFDHFVGNSWSGYPSLAVGLATRVWANEYLGVHLDTELRAAPASPPVSGDPVASGVGPRIGGGLSVRW